MGISSSQLPDRNGQKVLSIMLETVSDKFQKALLLKNIGTKFRGKVLKVSRG